MTRPEDRTAQAVRMQAADELDAARYRKLMALNYPEACRIMQYLKPDADRMLDQYIETFGPERVLDDDRTAMLMHQDSKP